MCFFGAAVGMVLLLAWVCFSKAVVGSDLLSDTACVACIRASQHDLSSVTVGVAWTRESQHNLSSVTAGVAWTGASQHDQCGQDFLAWLPVHDHLTTHLIASFSTHALVRVHVLHRQERPGELCDLCALVSDST